ncbi:hypothetical protein FNH22_23620 [Fulvivirga sp. M361]|uniref:hypothetical protein n=1 Tax=Fulvivirga sp. M361 TaxID=2594266 RepID=UPI00117B5BAE|nr:hypothetical protein [Fulvivirga sp. M361]TRX51752.1 hypothetical protein FNH22_23620 [Fulvivirga sp. M361]
MKFSPYLVTLLLTIGFVQAQTAETILRKHIENSGGKEAWNKVKSIRIMTKMSLPMGELKTKIVQMKPNFIYTETDAMGHKIVQGYDGTDAWMINPMTGSNAVQSMPEPMTKQLLQSQQSLEPDWIYYKEKGYEVILKGTEEVDGVETYKLQIIKDKDSAEKVYFYFDKENYMPVSTSLTMASETGTSTSIQTKLSDYKETNLGILMPHRYETSIMGQNSVIIFDEVVMNESIDKNIFKRPSE